MFSINLDIGNVVLEDGWDVDLKRRPISDVFHKIWFVEGPRRGTGGWML
jgi:hypothetical protein